MIESKVLAHCHTPDCGPEHTYLELECGHWPFVKTSEAPAVGSFAPCKQCSEAAPKEAS